MSPLDVRIEQILSLLFLFTRCSGIFIFTPFLSNFNIPMQVRVLLSFALGYLFSLTSPIVQIEAPFHPYSVAIGLAGELIVGMVIGFAAHTVFAGLQYAGHIIGFKIGLAFVNVVDPQSSNRSTTLAIYHNYLGLMLFLGFDGHHWFIESVGKSLEIVPPFAMHFSAEFTTKIVFMMGKLFIIGFQVAAPVLAVLVLTDVVLGIIGRSAPQIHILIIGFPIKVLVGISGLGLALYFFPAAMREYSGQLHRDLNVLLRLLGS